jgi:hypothetical protein
MPDLTLNSDGHETSAYVRQAKPSETSAIAAVLVRAFARDPMMNWLGGVRALVPAGHKGDEDDDDDASVRHTLAGLHHFNLSLVKMVEASGHIVVVVEKEGTKARRAEGEGAEGEGEGEGEGEKERILGCALWLKPATKKEWFPATFLRIGRLVWCWGLRGIKVCFCVCSCGGSRRKQCSGGSPPQLPLVLTVDADSFYDPPCRG